MTSIESSRAWRLILGAFAGPLALYAVFLGLGSIPFFQRHFMYAHKINTLWWTDLNEPERWGFAKNQVTPFSLRTHDGETVYAWHILPLPVYLKNEAAIAEQASGHKEDFTSTESFRILKEDPKSRLVIYFHGNAGHIAQNTRPFVYHSLTDTSSYHVLAVDYRGFGHSSGAPTEQGLIHDAAALVDWAMTTAGIPASRIVITGQSLGTAVTAGVAEHYALRGVEFAGIVLVAGFSHMPSLLSEYRIGGMFPVLAPLRWFPAGLRLMQERVVDKWPSVERLANIVRHTRGRLRISLVHALNDPDIPCTESDKLFRAAASATVEGGLDDEKFERLKEERTIHKGKSGFVTTWRAEPNIIIREEIFPYGGHNGIMSFAPVALAVMRSFDLDGTGHS